LPFAVGMPKEKGKDTDGEENIGAHYLASKKRQSVPFWPMTARRLLKQRGHLPS